MNNTRQQILDVSRKMFTERGFNGVSVKDIADAVGISKGNLTYHFAKKEDIMETLISDIHPSPIAPAKTIQDLNDLFLKHLEVMETNAFYFRHYDQLGQISMRLSELQKKANLLMRSIYEESFRNLIQSGELLERDRQERVLLERSQCDAVIDALILGAIYWPQQQRLLYPENKEINAERYLNYCWNQLAPWRI